ncbi:F-box domain, cyclin-like domain containing protein [Pseudohyphozyma bogoriensis]|nr:F-box domain, cyclin-like domain containing protein [Pseudohyphozyma bogoriensis]
MSDLLHDALLRAHEESHSPTQKTTSQLQSLHLSSDSEDELIEVRTPIATPALSVASTPSASRSASPTRAPGSPGGGGRNGRSRSGAGKPRRDKTKELAKAAANAATMDPLAKFPGEVNVRIFGLLGVDDLLTCGLVSKKWRRSQTINWSWFTLLESITYVSPSERTQTTSGLPTWRRGDSKVDWAARYASICRRDDVEKPPSDVDEDGLTFKEAREAKWKDENEEAEALALDKGEARKYYKSLGNSKIKGKTGKGQVRTWEQDGLGGGGNDYV